MSTDLTTRRGFLNVAAVFEGGTLLAGLVLGWLAGVLDAVPISLRWADFGWGLLAVLPMLPVIKLMGDLRHQVADLIGRSLAACRWYDLVALALLAGLGEELLFRGVLQPWIGRWEIWGGNAWGAFIIANVLFGLAHALTPSYFFFAMLVGMYFSWLASGFPAPGWELTPPNLLRPIVAHAVYDFIAFQIILWDYRRSETRTNEEIVGNSEPSDEGGQA